MMIKLVPAQEASEHLALLHQPISTGEHYSIVATPQAFCHGLCRRTSSPALAWGALMQGDTTTVLTALTLMGTFAHHPSLRGSGTGIRTVLAYSLQEKGYKNSL